MITLTEELYRALVNCPCRCQHHWGKPIVYCARCLAVDRYERQMLFDTNISTGLTGTVGEVGVLGPICDLGTTRL